MKKDRYLVIGLAKTGTTAISKTIQNTAKINDYYLEPKNVALFETLAARNTGCVVKILYDHWITRPRLLNGIIFNELKTNFRANVFITRDPRAEIVSRLHYIAFPFFQSRDTTEEMAQTWIEIFRRKEQDPANVSLHDMVSYLQDHFGVFKENAIRAASNNALNYARYLGQLPDRVKSLLRYEDFVANNLDGHPLRNLFSGSREVGEDLQRTRRSGGTDDWGTFFLPSDHEWMESLIGEAVSALGYKRDDVPAPVEIVPEHCSIYVERIIREGRQARAKAVA